MSAELQQRPDCDDDTIQRSDREEFIGSWLEDHDVGIAWHLAPVLARSGVDRVWLEELVTIVDPDGLSAAVRWITSSVGMMSILSELADSTSRISHLVEDVKTYSAMDRAEFRRIDVTGGIDSTLTMPLQNSERSRCPDYDDLPRSRCIDELNLLDKLIDTHRAMDATHLALATRNDGKASGGVTTAGAYRSIDMPGSSAFLTAQDAGKGTVWIGHLSSYKRRHDGEITSVHPGSTTARCV